MMHGMELGLAGMHIQIALWAKDGFFSSLIHWLLDEGFDVFVTSDHGNIEAKGRGSLSEGVLAEMRGERVRVFNSVPAREAVLARVKDAFDWVPAGLPDNYLPLFLKDRTAFVPLGETVVGHGGCTIEELIVPFVWIRRSK